MNLNIKRISELMDSVYSGVLDNNSCEEVMDIIREFVILNRAFEMACWLLSMSSECFNGYCPLEKTVSEERYRYKCNHCPDCNNEKEWQEHFLQKARDEE